VKESIEAWLIAAASRTDGLTRRTLHDRWSARHGTRQLAKAVAEEMIRDGRLVIRKWRNCEWMFASQQQADAWVPGYEFRREAEALPKLRDVADLTIDRKQRRHIRTPVTLPGSRTDAPHLLNREPATPQPARVVEVQRGPAYTHDARYQVGPGEKVPALFAALGVGRYLDERAS